MHDHARPAVGAETAAILQQEPPDAIISRRYQYGQTITYLKTSTAITLANLAFGHGGWSTRVLDIAPVLNRHGQIMAYTATTRVTIHENGAQYEDTGGCALRLQDGADYGVQIIDDGPESHDTARKGAVSDAMKRCLRHLGPLLGNSLYESAADRIAAASAALDLWSELAGRDTAEDRVFGAAYQRCSEIPLQVSLAAISAALAGKTAPPPPAPQPAPDYYAPPPPPEPPPEPPPPDY